MKKIILLFFTVIFLAGVSFLHAQTAAELETVLGSPAVTYSQAAKFVLSSVGSTGSAGNEATFDWALSNGYLPKEAKADTSITLGDLSFLIVKAFDIKGGLMYSFFPGPRYAYRTMISRSYIQGSSDPAMTLSGERFLLILGKVLQAQGGE